MLRKIVLSLLAGLGVGTAGNGEPLHPLPNHEAALPWPTDGWVAGPLETVTDTDAIAALIDTVMATELDDVMGETRAIVIVHRGRLVAEAYRDGFSPDTKQVSWSMAKSITHALVGRAVVLGLIETIDAPMPSPWPAGDPRAQITWRQWLNMTDGLDYREIGVDDVMANDVVQMMFGQGQFDVIEFIRTREQIHPAGTHWNYSTASLHLVGRALQTLIGADSCTPAHQAATEASGPCPASPAKMRTWMDEVLFDKLGMAAQPEFDAAGTFLGGSLVWASARDFAKFGYLYLRDGTWAEEPLLPDGWADFARSPTSGTNANVYGAGWWITPPEGTAASHSQAATICPCDAFHAGGHEGQTIWVVPSKDLVIVRLGLMENNAANWGALYTWNQLIAQAFPDVDEEEADMVKHPGGAK